MNLQLRDVKKRFVRNGPDVVARVSLDLAAGELLSLVGPSGCGKTTLLRLIAGFESPDDGEIWLGENCIAGGTRSSVRFVPAERRHVGVVFQDFALFPHMTVLSNVMYGLKGPRQERRLRAEETLQMLQMEPFMNRLPHTLSGGQQQRVAIARSIAPCPRLLLLDEPFSNLDPALRMSSRTDVRQLLRQQKISAILVTHDRDEALSFGDRVAVMQNGKILQIGLPESVYFEPENQFVAKFLSRAQCFPARADGLQADSPLGKVTLQQPCQGNIQIAVRPEQIQLIPAEQANVTGKILLREFHGSYTVLHIQLDTDHQEAVIVVCGQNSPCQPGTTVGLNVYSNVNSISNTVKPND